MADIVLPGITSNSPPGVYTYLQFAQGQSGAPTEEYSALILGNIVANGSLPGNLTTSQLNGPVYGPDTQIPCQSVQDAINLFGAGSPCALMFAAFKNVNQTTPLYVCPIQHGNAAVGATQVIIVASPNSIDGYSPATSASIMGNQTTGVIQYTVDGKPAVQSVFGAQDTAWTICTNLAAQINSNINLPVTAVAAWITDLAVATGADGYAVNSSSPISLATITVTAKSGGLRSNSLTGYCNVVTGAGPVARFYNFLTPNTAWTALNPLASNPTRFGSGMIGADGYGAANLVSGAAGGAAGAVSDNAHYTAALAALESSGQRYYYYIPEAAADGYDGGVWTSGFGVGTGGIPGLIDETIDNMALPSIGIRQRVLCASNDTIGVTGSSMLAIDDPRLECIQLNQCDLSAGEMASQWAAAVTLFETEPLSAQGVNFDNFGGDPGSSQFWTGIVAPSSGARPSTSDIQTAVISGITAIKCVAGNRTVVVKRVTSYFTDLAIAGSIDLRITDSGKVTICDRFFDDLSALISQRFPRMLIGNDSVSGAPPVGPGIVTVSKVTGAVLEVINQYASAGLINGSATVSGLVVQRNTLNSSSFGIVVPLFVADPAHQFLVSGLQNPAILI